MEHKQHVLARFAAVASVVAALAAMLWGPAPHAHAARWRVHVGQVAHDAPELLTGAPSRDQTELAEEPASEPHEQTWISLRQWLSWPLAVPEHSIESLPFQAWEDAGTPPGARISAWLTRGVSRLFALLAQDEGDRDVPDIANSGVLVVQPVAAEQSSSFGYRRHPITGRRKLHKGIDFSAKRGAPVYAAGAGVVTFAGRRGSYGRLIILSHGQSLETRYAHLRTLKVAKGQHVAAGTLIGTVGSSGRATGPHLHFEVRRSGEPIDPARALSTLPTSIPGELAAIQGWPAQPE